MLAGVKVNPVQNSAQGLRSSTLAGQKADRWALLILVLLGLPLPPMPAIPGTVHRCIGGVQADDDVADDEPDAEVTA
jgi:hypothetical protein